MDVTYGRVLKIAFPIILANSTVPILGAVDTFVVGQISSPIPIGAVAVGSLVISVLYSFFGFGSRIEQAVERERLAQIVC